MPLCKVHGKANQQLLASPETGLKLGSDCCGGQ